MTDIRVSTSEDPIPCPIPSPDGLPCTKTIEVGWTVEEGHGGGHFWASLETVAILDGGHYDARAALSGQPFAGHRPENCPGGGCQHRPEGERHA